VEPSQAPSGGFGFQRRVYVESLFIASPPHTPREDGLTHPVDTSGSDLLLPWVCFRGGSFPNPALVGGVYRIGKWPIKRHLRTIRH
jgi:hypothetical protein